MIFLVFLVLFSVSAADDPILHLTPGCPPTITGAPRLSLKADVPAYAVAHCKNEDRSFQTKNEVDFILEATFQRTYSGPFCQFYKKNASNTFTVDVEVGWGELGSRVINNKDIRTVSCAYDDHGIAMSAVETIAEWFLNPQELQSLLGAVSNATFALNVVDILGQPLSFDHIHIGRKIRLRAVETSKHIAAFRALSCNAKNKFSSYAILRAGCGDGLIFKKQEGFLTTGKEVYSPYFEAFKLRGSAEIQFECTFTACITNCDGDSCAAERKRRRRDLKCKYKQPRLFRPKSTY